MDIGYPRWLFDITKQGNMCGKNIYQDIPMSILINAVEIINESMRGDDWIYRISMGCFYWAVSDKDGYHCYDWKEYKSSRNALWEALYHVYLKSTKTDDKSILKVNKG